MEIPVQFELLKVGSCWQLESMALRGGRWKSVEFPALAGLIKHPSQGWLLFDTGYAKRFSSATARFPESLYSIATPHALPEKEVLTEQLKKRGIALEEIRKIIVSHYHADHVAGLSDFPKAEFIAAESEYIKMIEKSRMGQIRNAFLHELIPRDFSKRVQFVESIEKTKTGIPYFNEGYDLLGDRSLIGIPLPGHSHAQMGLLFTDQRNRKVFLIADACWKIEALMENNPPSRFAYALFSNAQAYDETFSKLVALYRLPEAPEIVPFHCITTWNQCRNQR